MSLFKRLLSAGEGKRIKELIALAVRVNSFEAHLAELNDADLGRKTVEFRQRLQAGESADDLEAEAFAVVREAARRTLGQRHFDVQVMGAGALHRGMIAEMKTGEGKTLVATMPSYLNALGGEGVHVVTVNDYLAKRDARWMGGVHRFLGLEVGLIQANMSPEERRPSYQADITYGTNNEFGFDYLRDNMAMNPTHQVQRGHHFGIVDEVDSILVDEARTPLIISGRVSDSAKWYRDFARIADRLTPDLHFEVDEGRRQVMTTEAGVRRVEEVLGIENMYDHSNVDLVHHLDVALRAKALYQRDVDYLVTEGEVKIVDEFTGRILEGRRYSEGLHQAIEAKEKVAVKDENQTLATITLQNYFRMYDKLAGMTGTALTEAGEFAEIYKLDVVEIPTNEQMVRDDQADLVYLSEDAKFEAVVEDLVSRHQAGQPVLVGTVSIEKSERLSGLLNRRGIPHQVLNAKNHEQEAGIIAQAGRLGAVTVATNMAGRGVDIKLGGNPDELARAAAIKAGIPPEHPDFPAAHGHLLDRLQAETAAEAEKVVALGGLYVLGTERHESRRIDNQLRGRSGRQGDPGESRFYLSLGDDLMRRFASDRVAGLMQRLRMPADVPIEHKLVTRSIERAQGQVEAQNFEIRKNVLKYDEVMNRQREIIYEWRTGILTGEDPTTLIDEWLADSVGGVVEALLDPNFPRSEWDLEGLGEALAVLYPHRFTPETVEEKGFDEIKQWAIEDARGAYTRRRQEVGPDLMRSLERQVVLSVIDNKWREHLAEMDHLRQGIGLRAMGQRDPLVEYQREGFDMFAGMVDAIRADAIRYLFHVQVAAPPRRTAPPAARSAPQPGAAAKVGRNDACPCGSGKKYKRCHGAAA